MCTSEQLDHITDQITKSYRRAYGNRIREIILYGSYARGTNDQESDIDITAIVDGDREYLQEQLKKVWDDSAICGLNNDVVISPTVIPAIEFERYKDTLPYYRNISKEGIRIG